MSATDLAKLTPEEKRALLDRLLAEKKQRAVQSFPLSFAQQRLWFIDRLQPTNSVYSIPVAVRLRGELDASRLERCLNVLVARHESLRTRFVTRDGAPVQVVDPAQPLALPQEELPAGMPALEGRLQALVEEPFDLERGPLIHCRLFAAGPREHVLALVVHHIAADYWSLQLLIRELAQLYSAAGEPSTAALPSLPLQYPDYAVWQQQRAHDLKGQLAYWCAQLADAPELLQLPADFPRPPMQSFVGARHNFRLGPQISAAVARIARERGMTPFMVLLAAFQLLLHRYSGADDILVGSTVSNRDRAELQGVIGLFVNNLVMRTRFEEADTFDAVLARVRATVLEAFANQDVPFEQVVDALDAPRSLSHNALFQAMFVLHNTESQRIALPDLELSPVEFGNRAARFDLSLDMYEGENYSGVFEYSTDLFRPSTIARLTGHFLRLLEAVTADPGKPLGSISLLSAAELGAFAARNRTAAPIPEADVATLIEARAADRGEAIALRFGDRELSYAALNAAANRLATHMRRRLGEHDGQPRIALCLSRSEELVIGLLAVLKLGAAYIPLDPAHPPVRLRAALEDSQAALMLTKGAIALGGDPPCPMLDLGEASAAIAAELDANLPRCVRPEDLAYVIFTSGSTGRPKGVPIRQDSLVNLLTSMAKTPGMSVDDTFVAVTTPAFDIATLELLMPLLVGGKLVVAEPDTVYDDAALTRLLATSGATMMQATPATWRLLVEAGWQAPAGFKILCGGEALDPALARQLLAGGGELWNLYGPTETTIWSAAARIGAEHANAGIIPLGEPIANTQLHVLDSHLQPVPAGVIGQLHIGGSGLSPGYWQRDDLTAAAFVANPFHRLDPAANSLRLYKTGDAVRRLEDGSLIYLGRLDFQVKLRGFRIELGDIEAALNAEPDIRQAVVVLHRDGEGDGELVAYCQAAPGREQGLEARLRGALAGRLPGYMIPSAFIILDALPLNANGKVDRKRLPRLEKTESTDEFVAPRTSTETLVAELWGEILGLPRVGREDHFFDRGGHSLLAARMIARLRPIFETTLPLRTLFETPRLKDFCASLDAALPEAGEARGLATIPTLPRGGALPLSFAQQRLWTLAQLEPDSPFYNIPGAVRLKGEPDFSRLARAFEHLCARHEVLRSRFLSADGRATVDVLPRVEVPLEVAAVLPEGLTEALLAEARRPFDLEDAPLLRVRLFPDGAGSHVLLLVLHHIIADALSVNILIRDLAQIYRELGEGRAPMLPPLPVQYADFAAWQRAQDTNGQLEYWRRTLEGAPPLLELPTDFPRPVAQGFRGESIRFTIDAALAEHLRAASTTAGATPFMAVLAVFAALLGRYSGMDDIVIGTPIAQRPHAELEGLVGLFVNTLALRIGVRENDSFGSLLERTRGHVLEAFTNQDVPFEQIVDSLSLPRNWSHTPLFQAMFVWNTQERQGIVRPEGLDWETVTLPDRTAKTDIGLLVHDGPDGLACKIEFRTDLFRRETIAAMAAAFTTLLKAALAKPSRRMAELSMLPASQKRLIQAWNTTARAFPAAPATLHGLIDARIAEEPDAIAATDRRESISYRQLGERTDRLARAIAAMGIGRGQRVGVCMPRGVDLVCAILGVLKTGAAYVPLDPRYPKERIAFIAADTEMSLLLTQGADAPDTPLRRLDLGGFWDTPAGPADAMPLLESGAEGADLAYIIYTSGSTGKPKGVALEHRNGVAFVRWALDTFSRDQLAGMLGSTSVCFDLSIFEIFATLSGGGRLLIVDDLFDLHGAPFANEVTLINTVPTAIAELIRLGPLPAGVTTVTLAGETLPPSTAAMIHAAGTVKALHNLWGPTEDTTFSSGEIVPPAFKAFGIGGPITNSQAYVLDAHFQQAPIGMPGEIYLAGAGIARGYWRRPDLTAERFLPNPFASSSGNAVLYRTGDRGRWLPDGRLDFLGRADRQVKLRGFRIEPGEVEAVLLGHPAVEGAVVDVWRDATGNARLAAWMEGSPPPSADVAATFLRERLPEHMVPTLLVRLPKLPRLPNGKLDRNALPDPVAPAEEKTMAPPCEGLERQLAAIWAGLLGRADIGRDDNFFALGGDSILAIQVVAKARQAGLALLPRDIFQHPTLTALAAGVADRVVVPTLRGPLTGPVPLGAIQRWFLERDLPQAQHWNQGLMLKPTRRLDADRLEAALGALAAQHDALRARFTRGGEGWEQAYLPVGDAPRLRRVDGSGRDPAAVIAEAAASLHRSFNLANGPLWGAALIDLGEAGQRLAIAAHHLLVDGLSWRIMLTDLQAHYLALEAGQPLTESRSSGFGGWVSRLSASDLLDREASYWNGVLAEPAPALPLDNPRGGNLIANAVTLTQSLDAEITRRLLQDAPAHYPVQINDLLLAALLLTMRDWSGQARLRIELESHGRPDLFEDIDLSRTVGWLTALYPVLLEAEPGASIGNVLLAVKNTLRSLPHDGIGYGVLRYLHGRRMAGTGEPVAVRFNYLGQTDNLFTPGALFTPSGDPAGPMHGAANPRDTVFDINALVSGGRLHVQWTYSAELHRRETVAALAAGFNRHLAALADHCLTADDAGYTPADFALMDIDQGELDDLLSRL